MADVIQPSIGDREKAAIDLIGRAGATALEVGFLHDDVPADEAGWWAAASYRGARVTVEDKRSPEHALDALLARVLAGSTCRWCARPVTNRKGRDRRWWCIYVRERDRYVRGCEATHTSLVVPVPAWARGGEPADG